MIFHPSLIIPYINVIPICVFCCILMYYVEELLSAKHACIVQFLYYNYRNFQVIRRTGLKICTRQIRPASKSNDKICLITFTAFVCLSQHSNTGYEIAMAISIPMTQHDACIVAVEVEGNIAEPVQLVAQKHCLLGLIIVRPGVG